MPEVVEDGRTGILVPPRDHEAMADAIVTLLHDATLRERMGEAGLSLVSARFSSERMVLDTVQAYEHIRPLANTGQP
jgi:glycosyltransferase involved in cell wall biosynthesis